MPINYVPPGDVRSAPWTRTFANITLATAIKTSIATVAAPATYSGAGLNGSIGANPFTLPQLVTVTTSSHAGSYTIVSPIVVTGKDEDGNTIADNLQLTLVDGGETLKTSKAFAQVTSITIPTQNDTSGAFTFGVDDIVLKGLVRELRGGSNGNVVIKYQDGTSDTLACLAGEHHKVFFNRVTGSGTTALPLVIYG